MDNENNWCIVRTGGCLEEENRYTHRYKGFKCCIQNSNMIKEQAQLKARQYNKMVTPGSRKYYGIHYYATLESKVKEIEKPCMQ